MARKETKEITLEELKKILDEENYPYFTDEYLQTLVDQINDGTKDRNDVLKQLLGIKAGIKEMKLGDLVIPGPGDHFRLMASSYRRNYTGVRLRADRRD